MYGALFWAGLSGWYLLLKSNVRKYFNKKPNKSEQATPRKPFD